MRQRYKNIRKMLILYENVTIFAASLHRRRSSGRAFALRLQTFIKWHRRGRSVVASPNLLDPRILPLLVF